MVSIVKQRIFLSLFFFSSGFTFSTWASRIPTIKTFFDLNDAELGTVLLAMPVMSLIGLPLSGWMVSKFDSRKPMCYSFVVYAISLALIGFSQTVFALVASICLFAFSVRIFGIALNTQAVTLQDNFGKKIMGSLHGLWSTGGIFGILFSTFLLAENISIEIHFLIVAVFTIIITVFAYPHLMRSDVAKKGNKIIIGKPDPYILYLGLLAFFAALCEGGMFDWSGIYFHEVLKVKIFTYGYLIFMTFMAMSRFLSDAMITRIGMATTYMISSACIVTGILLAIVFPRFWFAMAGFSLVGFGTASIIPMTFTLASGSKKYSPGLALSIISTYFFVGMLLGPPLIGYLAHAFNLRVSFILFAFSGMMFIPISHLFFKYKKSMESVSEIPDNV
ncbi:MAG TPA: MFS transporter [Sphingobacteriaceae bacterium]|nr:MFS transporter [Sphingobacteriaceae bacterium]